MMRCDLQLELQILRLSIPGQFRGVFDVTPLTLVRPEIFQPFCFA